MVSGRSRFIVALASVLVTLGCARKPIPYEKMALGELAAEIVLLRMEAEDSAEARANFLYACELYTRRSGRPLHACPDYVEPSAASTATPASSELPAHVSDDGSIEPCRAEDYVQRGSRPDWSIVAQDVKTAASRGDKQLMLRILCGSAAWNIADAELGLCLASTAGVAAVEQDLAAAEHWCRLARDHGHPDADFLLANVLLGYQPTPALGAEIVQLLSSAAQRGNADAAAILVGLYLLGEYVPPSYDSARQWAAVADQLGSPSAPELLRLIDEAERRGGQ